MKRNLRKNDYYYKSFKVFLSLNILWPFFTNKSLSKFIVFRIITNYLWFFSINWSIYHLTTLWSQIHMNSLLISLFEVVMSDCFGGDLGDRSGFNRSVAVLIKVMVHFWDYLRVFLNFWLHISEIHGALIVRFSHNSDTRLKNILAVVVWWCRLFVKLALFRDRVGIAVSLPLLHASSEALLVHDINSRQVCLGI